MSDLQIPLGILGSFHTNSVWTAPKLRTLVAPIVAAELRRLANVFDLGNAEGPEAEEARHIVRCLRQRANDLDGGAS